MKLLEAHYVAAAAELGCEVAAIKAVAEVESAGDGFLPNGMPKILFEAHIFSTLTDHMYDEDHPNISSPRWNRHLYLGGEGEHDRLAEAAMLDRESALQAASWGKFQILGRNWEECGYGSLQQFINDMYKGEVGHLKAFVGFVKHKNLVRYLQSKNFAKFAEGYNGASYKVNKYDEKMLKAYRKYSN